MESVLKSGRNCLSRNGKARTTVPAIQIALAAVKPDSRGFLIVGKRKTTVAA